MKNNKKLHIIYGAIIVVLLVLLFLKNCGLVAILEVGQELPLVKEFTYSEEGKKWIVTTQDFAVKEIFTPLSLRNNRCNAEQDVEYFEDLLEPYSMEDIGRKYFFSYEKPSQGSPFIVTVIPNKLTENHNFIDDFAVCSAGEKYYPHLESDKYLLFVSSCGSGGGPNTYCDEAKEAIEPTLKLK